MKKSSNIVILMILSIFMVFQSCKKRNTETSEILETFPEPPVKEVAGLKLLITYQNLPELDLMEISDNTVESFLLAESNNNIANIKSSLKQSNIVIYNSDHNYVDFFNTGIETHINHLHVNKPFRSMANPVKISSPSSPIWQGYYMTVFGNGDGSVVYNTSEGLLNRVQAMKINGVSNPHKGISLITSVNERENCVVSTFQSKNIKDLSGDKIIAKFYQKNDLTRMSTIFESTENLGEIKAGTILDKYQVAVFATTKGLYVFNVAEKKAKLYESHDGASFNILLNSNRESVDKSVYAISESSGMYRFSIKDGTFTKLIDLKNITEVKLLDDYYPYMVDMGFISKYEFDNFRCFVLTKENNVYVYKINPDKSFTQLAKTETPVFTDNNITPKFGVSRRYVYIGQVGTKKIARLSSTELKRYRSIEIKNSLSDLETGGNLQEMVINNH